MYVPIIDYANLCIAEKTCTAVLVIITGFRLIKYMRNIPAWGPMVLSVILSFQDENVYLYLLVLLFFVTCFSLSYTAIAAAENDFFRNVLVTATSVFRTAFSSNYDNIPIPLHRTVHIIIFAIYVIIALVMINLLIGIVSDVII